MSREIRAIRDARRELAAAGCTDVDVQVGKKHIRVHFKYADGCAGMLTVQSGKTNHYAAPRMRSQIRNGRQQQCRK